MSLLVELDEGQTYFTLGANCSRAGLGPDWVRDHLFKRVMERLLWSGPECGLCFHTCPNNRTKGGKQMRVWFKSTGVKSPWKSQTLRTLLCVKCHWDAWLVFAAPLFCPLHMKSSSLDLQIRGWIRWIQSWSCQLFDGHLQGGRTCIIRVNRQQGLCDGITNSVLQLT